MEAVVINVEITGNENYASVLGAFAKLRKATTSLFLSVFPSVHLSSCNNSAQTGRIRKICCVSISLISATKSQVLLNLTRITGTYRRHMYIYDNILLNYS